MNRSKPTPSLRRGRRASLALVSTVALLGLVAAACGGDDDDAAEAATTVTSVASAPATAAPDTSAAESDASSSETSASETSGSDMSAESGQESGGEIAERPADWPTTITFGAVPAEQASSLEADFATTRAILIDELGLDEIEFFQATDYAGIIEGVIAGRVDVAQFGGFSYVIATGNGADVTVAGVMTDGPDIEPGYRSYGITQADNDEVTGLADYAGKTICFVDPGSTSGFLFPSAGLLEVGIDPSETSTDITPTFAGGHDASAIAVKNGDCDAGFAYDSMVTAQLVDSGDIAGVIDTVEDENVNPDSADLKIVWKSEIIAGAPMAISNSLPQSFIDAYTDVVTTKVNVDYALENGYCSGTPEENDCSFADEEDTWGFVAKDDSFYDGIRAVCDITQASNCVS